MPSRFKLFIIIILLFSSISLTGCWGSKELDEAGYAMALGLDIGPGHNLIVSVIIDNPGVTSGSAKDPPSISPGQIRVFTAQAPTLFSGLNLINTVLENQIELSHTKMVIFGEDLARQGIEPYMDALTRWRKFRRTFYIAVAQGEARQVIESIVPPTGVNGAKFIETMFTSQQYVGYTPENQLLMFYNALKAKGADPIAALIASRTNKYELTADKENRMISGATDFKTDSGDPGNDTAGNPPLSGDGSLQFLGTAVFRRDKMVAKLTGNETMVLKMLRGELTRTFISVPDPEVSGKMMQVELSQIRGPQIKVVKKGNQLRAKVHLTILDDPIGIESNRQYETPANIGLIKKAVEKWISEQCFGVFHKAQTAGSDIFGFGNYAHWLVPDWPAWQKWDWNASFKTMKLDLIVQVHINRTGLIIKKNAVQGE
jgi:germination protein, Ger(x)C family